MDSSAKIMKATGIIHIIHGSILGLISFILLGMAMISVNIMLGLFLFVLMGGISFLYIYIGYALFKLCEPSKVKALLIVSIIFACIEVVASMIEGKMAGVMFLVEFIMSIVALSNLDAYRKYKNKIEKKTKSRDSRESSSSARVKKIEEKSSADDDEYEDDF